MKYLILLIIMIGFVSIVSANCEDGQIDINSASLEELDEIVGIGPAYAGRIVENRPFDSVDDLIRVSGIGEVTLENIKAQGLACVDGDAKEIDDEPDVVDEEVIEESVEEIIEESVEESVLSLNDNVKKKVETISLNGKVAEEEDNLVYNSKNAQIVDYLPYGFALFLIFIIGFLIWERF